MDLGPETLRSISHDMRNLLTAVRGHAELALRGLSLRTTRPARTWPTPSSSRRPSSSSSTSWTAATGATALVAVNLDSTVNAMRRLLDALLPPSIEMRLEPDSEGAHVTISKLRVERIVLNLVLNARDAMEDGGVPHASRPRRAAEDTAQIVVADTGPGFTDEALEHLFEVGFTTKRDRGGSGQGLGVLACLRGRCGRQHRGRLAAGRGSDRDA